MGYTLTLAVGAGLLAIWLDTRFPRLRPKTAAGGLTHAVVGVFVYRVLALLLPMPVSLAALRTLRKLAEGQHKPTGRRTSPRCAPGRLAILRSLDLTAVRAVLG